MAEFGELLRKAREEKGMTQQTLAEKLFVTRQAVSRWECGDRYPDLITTKKISQILEVSIDALLSENEMKVIAERNPIIENPIINSLMIALYAVISFSYLITVVDIIIRFPLESSQIDYSDIQKIAVDCFRLIIQMVIFLYGLVVTLKRTISPKKSGVIAMIYFFTVCLADSYRIFGSDRWQMTFIAILPILPSVAGAIASMLYFYKIKLIKISGWIIIIASAWGIVRMLITTCMTISYAGQFVSMNTALNLLLKSSIYLLLIYQVYVLNKKRKLSNTQM